MPLWTRAFFGLTFAYFLLFLNMQMMLAALPLYARQHFQASELAVSLITAVFSLSAIGGRFLTMAILNHVSRKTLLFLSILIIGSTTLAFGSAGSITAILLIRFCSAVGFGIASTVIPTWVTEAIPSRRMGEGIGIFGMSTMVAMAVGPSVGLFLLNGSGFLELTVFSSAIALFMLPVLWLRTRVPPNRSIPVEKRPAGLKKIVVPIALNIMVSITQGSIFGFLVLYGQEESFTGIGIFFLVKFFAIVVSRFGTGRILDRKGHGGLLPVGACLIIAGLIVLSYPLQVWTVVLSALLYGLGLGSLQPALHTWMLKQADEQSHGTANGMFYNAIDFGIAVGALGLGAVASYTGYGAMYGYGAASMAAFFLILAPQAIRARRKRAPQ